MSNTTSTDTAQQAVLRVIPITKPGVNGCSFAMAATDAVEAEVRANAAVRGCLAGPAMPVGSNPEFWPLLDSIKRNHRSNAP
jgi:hypothetical protein